MGINIWNIAAEVRKKTSQSPDSSQNRVDQYRATLRLAGVEIERRNRVIRALTNFGHQASRLAEPAALMQLALRQMIQTTSAQVGAIILIDRTSKNLSLGTHTGLTPHLIRILTGRQVDTGATILMPHLVNGRGVLLEIDDTTDEEEKRLLAAGEVSSLVSLPLHAGHHLLGALVVGIREQVKFPPADIHFLMAIAQGTAVALEQLYLREKIWHMAEAMLLQGGSNHAHYEYSLDPTVNHSILPPVQEKLAEIVVDLGGNIGAVFTLDKLDKDGQMTLMVDYGLSPLWTSAHSQFQLSDNIFPFAQLTQKDLIVRDIMRANGTHSIPLLQSLQEEGVRSLIAAQIEGTDELTTFIFIAMNTPNAFKVTDIHTLLPLTETLIPLLSASLSVPTLPVRSVHIASMEREASDDDLESLLAAMMHVEEEVDRHNTDLQALNNISELLNKSLQQENAWQQIVSEICKLLEAEVAWLYFLNKELNTLQLEAHEGLPNQYKQQRAHLIICDDFIEGQVVNSQEAQFIYDVTFDPRYNPTFALWDELRAVAAVPLLCPANYDQDNMSPVVGVFALGTVEGHEWQPRQRRLLSTIANHLALAVNNTQLYDQVRANVTVLSSSNMVLKQVNDHLMENYKATSPIHMVSNDAISE